MKAVVPGGLSVEAFATKALLAQWRELGWVGPREAAPTDSWFWRREHARCCSAIRGERDRRPLLGLDPRRPATARRLRIAGSRRAKPSLDPDYRGGRPNRTTPAERDRIVAVARTRPDHQGVALTRWSIPNLCAHLEKAGLAVLSETALRHLLEDAGLSFQRTRSWKWSPDPDFRAKVERVLALYREPPRDGPVVCFDEMGPIQLIPHQGSGWAPVARPERLRATYKRPHGVRYLFGALDVHATACSGACASARPRSTCSASGRPCACPIRCANASTS